MKTNYDMNMDEAKRISLTNMFQKLVPSSDIYKGNGRVVSELLIILLGKETGQCFDTIDFYSLQPHKKNERKLEEFIRLSPKVNSTLEIFFSN